MEVISIDGTEYVRASVLAKRFKYTSDYLGQLCRAGKVDAKLVGRTWYVNPDSVTGHKSARYSKNGQSEKTLDGKPSVKISRKDVESVIRKETVKSLASTTERKSSNFLRRIEWKPLKYEADTADLLPHLKPAEPRNIEIGLAEATTIRIKGSTEPAKLVSESLPEVALVGSIKVASLDDDFDKELENIVIPDEDILKELVEHHTSQHVEPKETKLRKAVPQVAKGSNDEDPMNPSYPVAVHRGSSLGFTPTRVAEAVSDHQESSRNVFWGLWLSVLICAALGLFAVLSIEFLFVVADGSLSSSFTLTSVSL